MTASILGAYKVVLKNQAGAVVAQFDSWFDLSYKKTVNGIGSYTLAIDGNDPTMMRGKFKIARWFAPDQSVSVLLAQAEAALAKGLPAVVKRHPGRNPDLQGALLAIEPHSGSIKAMVGGTDFARSQFNRAVQAERQPGSVFKPIVYCTAIERGKGPDDTLLDAPVSYPGARPGQPWRPTNYESQSLKFTILC